MRPESQGFEALLLAAVFGVVGCAEPGLPAASGAYAELVVVGERTNGAFAVLHNTLESEVDYLGQAEPRFSVLRETPTRFDHVANHKNLLLLAALDHGAWAERVVRLLQPQDRRRLQDAGGGWFFYADAFARGQRVVIVVARTHAALDSLQRAIGVDVRAALERSTIERQVRALQRLSRPGAIGARGVANGFDIAVPPAWRVATPAGRWTDAVELHTDAPTRIVTVFWIDGVDSVQAASRAFLLGLQRDVMWRLHEDTLIEGEYEFQTERGETELRGVWQNAREVGGGPFVTRFVHHRRRGRLYGVQGQLFAPGRPKHPFMRELQAVIQTFRLEESA